MCLPKSAPIGLLILLFFTKIYAVETTHPEGHPAQGYEVVAIVDKAIRYHGASSRHEVLQKKGSLVSETGQTLSLFILSPVKSDGLRHWELAHIWDVSTGKEVMYKIKMRTSSPEQQSIESVRQAATATGFFPVKVLYKEYVSRAYGEDMPYSVGYFPEFGTYIHQTRQDWCQNYISTRRSAGCTRLCSEEAQKFFRLIENKGRGLVLAFDSATGRPQIDPKTGSKMYMQAYRTLVINTDSTPPEHQKPLLPVLQNRPVVNFNPQFFINNPQLINTFFQ